MRLGILVFPLMVVAAGCSVATVPDLALPTETHLRNVRQLTFGGENAEAYFSPNGKKLIFQSTRDGYPCDRIYTMNVDGSDVTLVSTGKGRTTCAYFVPNSDRIIYSSTHESSPDCPPVPDMSQGYVWGLYPAYDLYSAKADGSDLRPLTRAPGYDAEATTTTDGSKIVFTSMRDGDLDIYTMNADGGDVRRLTDTVGYDGGPFYSKDGEWIVYRSNHPDDAKEMADYKTLLAKDRIRPSRLDLWVMRADGSGKRRLTDNGAANFAPFFFPDGKRIIFVSNMHDDRGRNFDLYAIGVDGNNLERITHNESFDGFPMFSPDGKKLVFGSNRNNAAEGDTNVFIADWVD
ncbi:MAG: TolB family protein [Thermoanaerobaculia bacterium]